MNAFPCSKWPPASELIQVEFLMLRIAAVKTLDLEELEQIRKELHETSDKAKKHILLEAGFDLNRFEEIVGPLLKCPPMLFFLEEETKKTNLIDVLSFMFSPEGRSTKNKIKGLTYEDRMKIEEKFRLKYKVA